MANERLHACSAPVISHERGAHVWDVDGNRHVEYGSGPRSVSLGPAHPRVVEAVRREPDRCRRGVT